MSEFEEIESKLNEIFHELEVKYPMLRTLYDQLDEQTKQEMEIYNLALKFISRDADKRQYLHELITMKMRHAGVKIE